MSVVPSWPSPAVIGDAVSFDGSMWYVSNQDDTGKIAITPADDSGMPIDKAMGTGRWVMPGDVEVVIRRQDHPMFAHAAKTAEADVPLDIKRGICETCDQEIVLNNRVGWWLHVDQNGMNPGQRSRGHPQDDGRAAGGQGLSQDRRRPEDCGQPR